MNKRYFYSLLILVIVIAGSASVIWARSDPGGEAGQLKERLQVEGQPWIGAGIATVTAELATKLDLPQESGVVVLKVVPDGPADLAGIKKLDIITDIGGNTAQTVADVKEAVAGYAIGDTITLTISRTGEASTISIDVIIAEFQAPDRAKQGQLPGQRGQLIPRIPETKAHKLPGLDLEGVEPGDMFSHFLGSESHFTDKDGIDVTLTVIPCTVSIVRDDSLVLTPNGEKNEER